MPIFSFDNSHSLGRVREVDTRKVAIHVKSDEDLRKARVGQLVALRLAGALEAWLIGLIEKVAKSVAFTESGSPLETTETLLEGSNETVVNTVRLTLVGSIVWDASKGKAKFSRSLTQVPEIETECHVLKDKQLETFMNVISSEGDTSNAIELGKYTIDESAKAFVDGNKLFQRHAALLGSTGSGKSWTVASILERAAVLPSSNIVVFDLHGEYRKLSYARHLRIPGPEELGTSSPDILYLPYWLLNAEELQALFIDRSEFSAHNQVMKFQDIVIEDKKRILTELKKGDVLDAFTLDSPVPFEIKNVLRELRRLNEEMQPGAKTGTEKKGDFNGQFSRLLVRLESKLADRRYGFLFQAPPIEQEYGAMAKNIAKLMDYHTAHSQIKVIDFSEVPADILPIIVGLVARVIYQVQFWTNPDKRKPLAFICDEAHLYLPKKDGRNPVEQRAIEAFEKIAKEGRKYGVSLVIVSQRPSDVSSTVLSQCNNVISLRLTNGDDQATVRKLMPESLESLLDTLPIMDIGEALVVGDAVLLPSRIRVYPPKEQPLSATVDFWHKWQEKPTAPDFVQAVENMRKQSRSV
jgi:uncharacterized protein